MVVMVQTGGFRTSRFLARGSSALADTSLRSMKRRPRSLITHANSPNLDRGGRLPWRQARQVE